MSEERSWRRCSACKKPIALGADYYACNVSTCNQKRTALAFCSVPCWEVHLPVANHREAWAVEKKAPASGEAPTPSRSPAAARLTPVEKTGRRRLVRPNGAEAGTPDAPREVLIVASRLKEYVRKRSGYNPSDRVLEPLSAIVRRICDEAIDHARREGRQTVLDRDIPSS